MSRIKTKRRAHLLAVLCGLDAKLTHDIASVALPGRHRRRYRARSDGITAWQMTRDKVWAVYGIDFP